VIRRNKSVEETRRGERRKEERREGQKRGYEIKRKKSREEGRTDRREKITKQYARGDKKTYRDLPVCSPIQIDHEDWCASRR
jgi:hypothetical protein